MTVPLWAWLAFAAVVVMLAVDLLAHRSAHVIGFREAATWSGLWVALSLVFALVLGLTLGTGPAVDFTTAWLLEKSLSLDNLFVFALIALVFRGVFLAAGVAVVTRFTAVLLVFGAVLVWSAIKLLRGGENTVDPGKSQSVRMLRRLVPIS